MSKVINKIKFIDSFYSSWRNSTPVNMHFTVEGSNKLVDKVFDGKNNRIYSLKELVFLSAQDDENIEMVKNAIISNKLSLYNHDIDYKSRWLMKINSDKALIAFSDISDSNYSVHTSYILSNITEDNLDNLIRFIKIAKQNGYRSAANYNAKLCIPVENVVSLVKNKDIFNNTDEDVNLIIRSFYINDFSKEYAIEDLTKEDLDILKHPLSENLTKISKEQLDFLRILAKFMADYSFEIYNSSKEIVFSLKDEIISYLNMLVEKSFSKEELSSSADSLLRAINENYISEKSDLTLLTNKVKYGDKYLNYLDIGFMLSNLTKEKYEEYQGCSSELATLIKMKKYINKSFYGKVINSMEATNCLVYDSKINEKFLIKLSNLVNLGQLNDKQFESLILLIDGEDLNRLKTKIDKMDIKYVISFDEFMYIFENLKYMNMDYINSLENLKQSQRLLKIKESKEINETLKMSNFCLSKEMVSDFLKELDENKISLKDLMKKDNPLHLKDIRDYIEYKVISSKVTINSMTDVTLVKYMTKMYSIGEIISLGLEKLYEKIFEISDVKNLMIKLNLSEEFKEENYNNIVNFFLSNKFELVTKYIRNNNVQDKDKKGIYLIVKALMANKYEDLKFVKSDILKEISIDISNEAFESWKKTDTQAKGAYSVSDSSDFETIIRMGEIPVRSCMHYESGMYSRCLLSNFDTSKKMLTIHKNGKYVGRAVLRLTIMSNESSTEGHLNFVDFDSNESKEVKESNKELIIFLEKIYTTLDSSDLREVYPMIIELLKDKADIMNATVVASSYYSSYASKDCREENKYVFITASKNGSQYLDSFDGSTSNSYCYKRGNVFVYNR